MIVARRRSKRMHALQFTGTAESYRDLVGFSTCVELDCPLNDIRIIVPGGTVQLRQGDWLVRDPDTHDVVKVPNTSFFRDYDHLGRRGSEAA